jgi:nitrite reductase/ring-hydroxylating ferredoxin subunit
MPRRRDLLRIGSVLLASLSALALAVPGAAFVLSPLIRKKEEGPSKSDPDAPPMTAAGGDGFTPLALYADLAPNVPRSFPVVEARRDAWVKYPAEPVGLVWLVRQPEGAKEPVLALSAECPHLACSISLAPDGAGFFCPCHTSSFALDGARQNAVPPRGMDRLEVAPFDPADPDAWVRVRHVRFRTMIEEAIPLA